MPKEEDLVPLDTPTHPDPDELVPLDQGKSEEDDVLVPLDQDGPGNPKPIPGDDGMVPLDGN